MTIRLTLWLVTILIGNTVLSVLAVATATQLVIPVCLAAVLPTLYLRGRDDERRHRQPRAPQRS